MKRFCKNGYCASTLPDGLGNEFIASGDDDNVCAGGSFPNAPAELAGVLVASQEPRGYNEVEMTGRGEADSLGGDAGHRYFMAFDTQRASQDVGEERIGVHNQDSTHNCPAFVGRRLRRKRVRPVDR